MSSSTFDATSSNKYNGVRRRKWGKWVSEIRVPGTSHRLWLGSYATPEAAAVAHDVATYCLRGDSSSHKLNFQLAFPAGARFGLSPTSVQKVASDAGLAVDAQLSNSSNNGHGVDRSDSRLLSDDGDKEYLDISVEDYVNVE